MLCAASCVGRLASARLYSSVVERQSCKLKVLGSIPSGGLFRHVVARVAIELNSPPIHILEIFREEKHSCKDGEK